MRAGRTLSYRHLVAVSAIQAISVLTGGPSLAGGPVSNESDILGIKLTMSRDQARKFVSENFPGSAIIDLPIELGTPDFKKSTVAGFLVDITSKDDQAANQRTNEQATKAIEVNKAVGLGGSAIVSSAGDHGQEKLLILVNPNESGTDIFAVSRYKEFTKANFPVAKVLLDSLIDKYGQPSLVKFGSSYTWMAPGVLERTQKPVVVHCFSESNIGSFLYENPKLVALNTVGIGFSSAVNNIDAGDKVPYDNISKCGTVLQVNLDLTDDRTYVKGMMTRLIDLTRGHAELKQFTSDFWRGANDAKQAKVSRDSQNKPKL
jgi:hypothetical protein